MDGLSAQQLHHGDLVGRIEGGHRLVSQNHRRGPGQNPGQMHPGPFAAGQGGGRAVGQRCDVGVGHRLLDSGGVDPAIRMGELPQTHHLPHCHRPVQAVILRQIADATGPVPGGQSGQIDAPQRYPSGDWQQTGHRLQQGAFSGTIGAENAGDRACRTEGGQGVQDGPALTVDRQGAQVQGSSHDRVSRR
ncbi:hypothetical protein GCM10027256_17910 [Novispirillum itersonii subsp. nipponicum]